MAAQVLCTYYQAGGSGANGAFAMKVAGLNDDNAGSLDSRITWTNQTGLAQWVHCYAFAFSGSTGGTATLVSQVNGGTPQVMTDDMHGLVEYDNNI
ncbi:MAG TPA: hypothetical protein VJ385_00405 [Fibrobacteria bacterium]|nr:hypothetical protein [Fibrobacteria bacterium]